MHAKKAVLHPTLSEEYVPLYHGASLFSDPGQRAALYSLLGRILQIERCARKGQHSAYTEPPSGAVRGDQKASHAFLLCSGSATIPRGDSTAVAIALWRIRMFEGADWTDDGEDKWILRQKYLSVNKFE